MWGKGVIPSKHLRAQVDTGILKKTDEQESPNDYIRVDETSRKDILDARVVSGLRETSDLYADLAM